MEYQTYSRHKEMSIASCSPLTQDNKLQNCIYHQTTQNTSIYKHALQDTPDFLPNHCQAIETW